MIYKYMLYLTSNKTIVLQNSKYMDDMVPRRFAIFFHDLLTLWQQRIRQRTQTED